MAAGLRPGVRHRHQQPHPPGAQPGRLPVHRPGDREPTATKIGRILRERVDTLHGAGQFTGQLIYVDVSALEAVDRQFLVERQLISREHAEAEGARGVAIDPREQVSVMINEEDHLRIQVHARAASTWPPPGSRSTSSTT